MKKIVSLIAVLLLALVVIAPAYAQQQAPKGTEGPDIRKKAKKKTASTQAPKGTEGPDIRKQEPKGTEGPGIRKVEPKGTEGPDIRKSDKKQ